MTNPLLLVLGFSSSFWQKNSPVCVVGYGLSLQTPVHHPADGPWLGSRLAQGPRGSPVQGRVNLGAWPRPGGGKGLASGWGCGHPVHPHPSESRDRLLQTRVHCCLAGRQLPSHGSRLHSSRFSLFALTWPFWVCSVSGNREPTHRCFLWILKYWHSFLEPRSPPKLCLSWTGSWPGERGH